MADVTVFVDDAVRGTLPGVCAKDGVATVDHLVIRDQVGDRAGLGVAWLLLLAGPLGWLGLVVISYARGARSEVLTVEVPMSEPAYQRIQAARSMRRRAVVVGVLAGFLAATMFTSSMNSGDTSRWAALALIAGAVLIGAIVAAGIAERRERNATVQVDLDASRRWVTLSRVHPTFAAACQAQDQRQVQRT